MFESKRGGEKNPRPKKKVGGGGGGGGGTKEINFQGSVCRRCVLAAVRTPKLGRTKVGNEAKSLKYSEKKSCISYQFRADVKT